MDTAKLLSYILVMAAVTYLIRMLPLTLFKRRIDSPFIKSFLHYVPFAVLGAMTFPEILYSTASPISAIAGLGVAVVAAVRQRGLLTVAVLACSAVFAVELLMRFMPAL